MKTKIFKKGDKVRYVKEPTEADWIGVGKVSIPFKINDVLEVYAQNSVSHSLVFENSNWGYPVACFELYQETYKYEVVHTETQEQWDFVCKIQNYKNLNWSSHGKESCINLTQIGYADKDGIAYGNGQAKIYSFEEWLDKFGHKSEYLKQNQKEEQWIPQVGDYVITKGYFDSYDGRILKITKIDSNRYYYFEVFDKGYYDKEHNFSKKSILRKALPHEIPTQELSKEDLLAEAKRRYPVGTKYWNLNRAGGKSVPDNTIEELPVIGKNWKFEIADTKSMDSTNIIVVRDENEQTHGWVYAQNTWAEIVEEPKVTEKSDNFVLPEKWYCKRTKENSKILNTWNNKKYDSHAFCEKGEGCVFSDKNYTGVDLTNYGEYKEISFEQFTKHVLNKSKVVKEKSWKEVSIDMMKPTENLPFKVTGYDESVTKKLTSSKILPIKVRNSNITELPKRTRIKIIKKQLLTI